MTQNQQKGYKTPPSFTSLSHPSFLGQPPLVAFAKEKVTKYFDHRVTHLRHVVFFCFLN